MAAARECVARHRAMPKGRGYRGVGDAVPSPAFSGLRLGVRVTLWRARCFPSLYWVCVCDLCRGSLDKKNKKMGSLQGSLATEPAQSLVGCTPAVCDAVRAIAGLLAAV